MPLEMLIQQETGLSRQNAEKAVLYIRELQKQEAEQKAPYMRQLGALREKFVWMADDFDETPEDFKDYM